MRPVRSAAAKRGSPLSSTSRQAGVVPPACRGPRGHPSPQGRGQARPLSWSREAGPSQQPWPWPWPVTDMHFHFLAETHFQLLFTERCFCGWKFTRFLKPQMTFHITGLLHFSLI